jgi:hypothetical protein
VRFLCLLYGPEGAGPAVATPEFGQMLADDQAAMQAMAKAGVLVDRGPLQPVSAATTVRVCDGETEVTAGPFTENWTHAGGFLLLDCADMDEGVRWVAETPAARFGSVEVRPLMTQVPG